MALLRESGLGQPDEVRLPYPRQSAPEARAIAWKPANDAYHLLAARLRQSGYEHELYFTQRALLQMLDHSSGSESDVEGLLWGRVFVSPDSGFTYVLIAETSPGISGASARVSAHGEGPLRPAGWYCSRGTIGMHLDAVDVAIHLDRCTGGWEPAVILSRGSTPADGGVFLVSPLGRRSYRAPFRELLEPELVRPNAPKRSCIPWQGYVTDEPVVALPSRERGLAKRRNSSDLADRPIVALIAEGVADDVRTVTGAIARAAKAGTSVFRRTPPRAPVIASAPVEAPAPGRPASVEPLPPDDATPAAALSAALSAAPPHPEPSPIPEAPEPSIPPAVVRPPMATPRVAPRSAPAARRTVSRDETPRVPAFVLMLGAIAALVGAVTLVVVAVYRVLPLNTVSAGAVTTPPPDESAAAAPRARALTVSTDSLASALLWYEELDADHRAGRLSCTPVIQARNRVVTRRDSLAAALAGADSLAAAAARPVLERADAMDRAFAASDCGAVTVRTGPND